MILISQTGSSNLEACVPSFGREHGIHTDIHALDEITDSVLPNGILTLADS